MTGKSSNDLRDMVVVGDTSPCGPVTVLDRVTAMPQSSVNCPSITQSMKELSDYIQIDRKFWDHYSFEIKNKSVQVKKYNVHRFFQKISKILPKFLKGSFFFRVYNRINSDKPQEISFEDRETLAALDKEFVSCNAELSSLLKIDLSVWE